ncbi:dTDP-4-dehydrorhamnose reductase [Candidatus Kinetoplastidibacterium crithidiae]|uniref:dTDP-4-dehydrorhamnose reductase n=1 Tax=Candidatus Kinetoplastidibacterium crithidiae TCC036E TaxID=1208918 RepID=M1LTL6_9PROT|nr:dTDP-4-dehydrorhamnose reductase [Candidatus Kinetoplastibacterium crithidii]AGF47446.1 dTDP-4-dehydrorhamnose reductase [Candidatus Kinetoplastibacterium crithidii TCC036E]
MKIILIGSKGQLGAELYTKFIKIDNIELICWDRNDIDFIYTEAIYYKLLTIYPDIVINAVAYTDVEKAEHNIELTYKINYESIKSIVRYIKDTKSLLVHFSSDYVFDGKNSKRYKESDYTNPLNIYGHSKLAADLYILNSSCNSLIFRTSWIFSAKSRNFLKKILELSKIKETINVVDDQYGSPLSAKAIAEITVNAIMKLYKKNGVDIYNVSINNIITRYDLASLFLKKIRKKSFNIKCNKIISIKSEFYNGAIRPKYSCLLGNKKLINYPATYLYLILVWMKLLRK